MNTKKLQNPKLMSFRADDHTQATLERLAKLSGITKAKALRVAILYAGATFQYFQRYIATKPPRYANSDTKIAKLIEIAKTPWIEE